MRDVGGLELVALGGGEPVQLADVLLEAVAARQVLLAGAGEHLGLELVDVVLERLDHGIEGVGEAVQDAVDERLLVVDRRSASSSCRSSSASHLSWRTVAMKPPAM